MSTQEFVVRDFKPEDLPLIMSTWLKGLYYGETFFSDIPKNIFMDNYKKFLIAILERSVVKVACSPEDADQIFGYSVLSPDFTTIHWVFVKTLYRNKGIAKSLVPQYPTYVSHLTPVGKTLLSKFKDCVFNPFAV